MTAKNDSHVGISEASRILGVSEPALRIWTDEGRIKSFITPGGHRRYSRNELKKFMNPNQKVLGVRDLATELESSISAHRAMDVSFLQSISWYSKLDGESQQRFASLGRSLLTLIIKSISEPSRREDTDNSIRAVGREFGEMTFSLGLPLVDSLNAFIQHRDSIVRVTSDLMKKSESLNRRMMDAIPLVDHAMDEALIFLVAAHQGGKTGDKALGG